MAKELYVSENYELYDGDGTFVITRKEDGVKMFVHKTDVDINRADLLVKSFEARGLKDETAAALFEFGNIQKQISDLKMKALDFKIRAFTW